jgi:hypothetical protein
MSAEGALRARVEVLEAALRDMLSGWQFIRETQGDLYGVEWDRAEERARAALQGGQAMSAEGVLRDMLAQQILLRMDDQRELAVHRAANEILREIVATQQKLLEATCAKSIG